MGESGTDVMTRRAGDEDRAVAERLVEEIRASPGQLQTWRKATTLLDMFGLYGLAPADRERIDAALTDAGLQTEPRMAEVKRHETLRLWLPEEGLEPSGLAPTESHDYSVWEPLRAVQATEWRRGEEPVAVSLFQAQPQGSTRWYEINVLHAEPSSVFDALQPLCTGLTLTSVESLLDGSRPTASETSDANHVRLINGVGVAAHERAAAEVEEGRSKSGELLFQPVALATADTWVVTCWHKTQRYRGAQEIAVEEPERYEQARAAVAKRWQASDAEGAPDLSILILAVLASSHADARAELEAWLESWELDFYRHLDETERETLIEIRGLVAELRKRLVSVDSAASVASWFPSATASDEADRVDAAVGQSIRHLRELSDLIRTSLDLVAANSAAAQLRLARNQTRQTEHLQGQVAIATSIFLVPTLIASVFGANTELPGRGEWEGFVSMLLLMVVGALLVYFGFNRFTRRMQRRSRDERGEQ